MMVLSVLYIEMLCQRGQVYVDCLDMCVMSEGTSLGQLCEP